MKNDRSRVCNRRRLGSIFIVCILLLTGCKNEKSAVNDMKNVEQRGYATILVISNGADGKRYHFDLGIAQERRTGEESEQEEICSFDCNDFQELSEKYQMIKGKDLSLAHLKVILLGKMEKDDIVNQKTVTVNPIIEELAETLQALDENEEIAKTCPVLQLEDREAFLNYLEAAKEPVGTYISSLVEAGERQGKDIPWLKDYLKVVREGKVLLIYNLQPESEGWTLKCSGKLEG